MPRPRLHDENLRARLLEVASRVISAQGESAVTVRSVAADCGTSASAVYALFGSREALVAAVSEEGFRRFGAHLDAVPRTEDPAADLAALGMAYRDSALADPHFYRVMFDRAVDASPPQERSSFRALRDATARVLASVDPADRTHADEPALALWALAHGLVGLELAGLMPGDDNARMQRYRATLLAAGPSLLSGLTAV
jgi:AcrR family transcriptional regulator